MNIDSKPWLDEADSVDWVDPATGYQCAVRRTPELMILCGYVQLPQGHPAYGSFHDDAKLEDISVHGGLTFAGTPLGESGFWVGFDCGHYNDLTPGFLYMKKKLPIMTSGIYRDMTFVMAEVTSLAKQLKEMNRDVQ